MSGVISNAVGLILSSNNASVTPSIETKLEMLERRFTMPASCNPSERHDMFSDIQDTQGHVHSKASQDSQLVTLNQSLISSNNVSHHAFSFDTPSLSYQSQSRMSQCITDDIENTPQIQLPLDDIKMTSLPGAKHSIVNKGLANVVEAATKHMKKVADFNKLYETETKYSESDELFLSQNSNPTVITSHVAKPVEVAYTKESSDSRQEIRRVSNRADSDKAQEFSINPVILEPNDVIDQSVRKKRKTVPVKREIHSVKLSVIAACVQSDSSKVDLNVTEPSQCAIDSPIVSSSTIVVKDAITNDGKNTEYALNHKCSQNVVIAQNTGSSKSNDNLGIVQHQPLNRDGPRMKNGIKAKNIQNTSIYDFFSMASKENATVNATKGDDRSQSSKSPKSLAVDKYRLASQRKDTERAQSSPEKKQKANVDFWIHRCQELEQVCNDKEEQLKAVSNNRTIVHSALREALRQRENDFLVLQQEKEKSDVANRLVLEKLVRQNACQKAREIREKLATDGIRLGRIVYSRAGGLIGRSSHLESWEDGHATKELEARRLALVSRRSCIESRYAVAIQRYDDFQRQKQSHKTKTFQVENAAVKIADDHNSSSLSELDVVEAVESARLQLSLLVRDERDLSMQEEALNDEKGKHIRALKRVASEDASRFRSRPKLHGRYILEELLGKGGFSEVWRAFDLVDLREVAVKIHQLDPRWPEAKKENYTKHVSREYEIHRNVRHPKIVSLFNVFEIDTNSFATVLECCNGTDLDTLLKARRRLPENEARAIILQIISGMQYLSQPSPDGQRQGIIHYDLKPGNILLDEDGDAKITDFGLSKIIDTTDPAESMELTSQGAGTYWYLPPECFVTNENVRISNKVDVWSIGVIFYQMLYGKRPFGDGQSQEKIFSTKAMLNAHEVNFPDDPAVSNESQEFVRACLMFDQSFRPTIAQLCENPYVVSRLSNWQT